MTAANRLHRAPVRIDLVADVPACPHCGRKGLLAVKVPRAVAITHGPRPVGTFEAVLCEACSLDDPYAAPLVVFFTVHGTVDEQTVEACADLLRRWLSHLDVPHVTEDTIAADIEAWRDGEFD